MQASDIQNIITAVGFPIFSCLALGWFVYYQTNQNAKQMEDVRKDHKEEVTKMTEALNNNTLALQRLIDKLGDDNEK